jgi:bifunctional enzyme CysN/CysC
VLAVNKMDLVGYDEAVFDRIVADYRRFANEAGIASFVPIPISGLAGDNITARSALTSWYDGPALLEHLESVQARTAEPGDEPFRLAVQWVNRPDQNFRGYAGRIASGRVSVGDSITVLPANRTALIERIVTFDGDLACAVTGQSVTLTLSDEIDCSRGDLIVSAKEPPHLAHRISADVIWMSDEKLVPHRSYWLKWAAQTLSASIETIESIVDVNSMEKRAGEPLALNDIGRVRITLGRPIAALGYEQNHKLGGFILIDKMSHATVAAGLVRGFDELSRTAAAKHQPSESIVWITGPARVSWAATAATRLKAEGWPVIVIDEAAIAGFPGTDLVHTAREVARLVASVGVQALVTIEAGPAKAHPGRLIDSSNEEIEGGEWVI